MTDLSQTDGEQSAQTHRLHFSVLTLFPDMIQNSVEASITGRALTAGHFSYSCHNIRDYPENRYGKVDDSLYGGGTGMLMSCEPIYGAWQAAKAAADLRTSGREARTIYLSPKGRVLDQKLVNELALESELILLCGHYEGIDQRVLDEIEAEEVSIGDYVITGGELAAAVLIDAVARIQEGVLPNEQAFAEESHYNGGLECRQYTKPEVWRDRSVPAILTSGHHAKIAAWREWDGLVQTYEKRADLLAKMELDEASYEQLLTFKDEHYD